MQQLAPVGGAFAGRGRGGVIGAEDRDADLVENIHPHQHQARDQRAREKVADRDDIGRENPLRALGFLIGIGDLVAEQDQHDGGRNDLAQRARGGDRAGGELGRIATFEHGRQGQQAHRHHGGADNAGRGRQQRADNDDGYAQPAAHGAKQGPHRFEQFLGNARFLQHHAHEDEERNGDEDGAIDLHQIAVNALREGAQMHRVKQVQRQAEQGKAERDTGQGEGNRIAAQQGGKSDQEHQEGQEFDDEAHLRAPRHWHWPA